MRKAIVGILLGAAALWGNKAQQPVKVSLKVIRAFDYRLPTLSNADMKAVFKEAKRMISAKLGDDIEIIFKDMGQISLKQLFHQIKYQHNAIYRQIKSWKYNLALAEDFQFLRSNSFRSHAIGFLKQYKLAKLQKFFKGKKIISYNDAFTELMKVYHQKIKRLKTLKTSKGKPLLLPSHPPYQSYVEWLGMMYSQSRYDVVFTNGLIVFDLLSEPYPHAIVKHAKVGGSSFTSPARTGFNGRSLLVNILEEYGEIAGLSRVSRQSRTFKNKILGGFLFAHEFGHAFYMIPDVYDHIDSCLMNSSMEQIKADEGYRLLVAKPRQCPHCQPWLKAKRLVVEGDLAADRSRFNYAADFYYRAAKATPAKIDGHRLAYIKKLLRQAAASYQKAKNRPGLLKIRQFQRKLK